MPLLALLIFLWYNAANLPMRFVTFVPFALAYLGLNLAAALTTNVHLEVLKLENNPLGDAGARALLDVVRGNRTLHRIDFGRAPRVSSNLRSSIEQELAPRAQRAAAIEAADGKATWGEQVELPPPTVDEVATAEFSEPLIRGVLEHREEIDA